MKTLLPLVRVFTWRAWVQQRTTVIVLSLFIGFLLGALVFTAPAGSLTAADLPVSNISETSQLVGVRGIDGKINGLSAYLLAMMPALLGALVAIIATLTLPGVVADDVQGGGIEVFLASPVPRQRLFSAYLGASLAFTSIAWGFAIAAFVISGVVFAAVTHQEVTLDWRFAISLIIIPFAMAVWSAAATLLGALLYPSSLETKAGMNGGPIRLLAMAPAIFIVPSMMAVGVERLLLLFCALTAGVGVATVVVLFVLSKGFRGAKVLAR